MESGKELISHHPRDRSPIAPNAIAEDHPSEPVILLKHSRAFSAFCNRFDIIYTEVLSILMGGRWQLEKYIYLSVPMIAGDLVCAMWSFCGDISWTQPRDLDWGRGRKLRMRPAAVFVGAQNQQSFVKEAKVLPHRVVAMLSHLHKQHCRQGARERLPYSPLCPSFIGIILLVRSVRCPLEVWVVTWRSNEHSMSAYHHLCIAGAF